MALYKFYLLTYLQTDQFVCRPTAVCNLHVCALQSVQCVVVEFPISMDHDLDAVHDCVNVDYHCVLLSCLWIFFVLIGFLM